MEKKERRSSGKSTGIVEQQREYLAGLRARKFSPKSLQTYGNALDCFLVWLNERGVQRAQDVTADDLGVYRLALVDRGFAASSLELYLRTVRQFFTWLEKTQQLFINPAAGLVIPKPSRKLQPVPTEEEVRKLLAAPNVGTKCGLRDRALLETAYATAARREELNALTIFDVNLDGGLLRVMGKGRKERMLPLGEQGLLWMRQYITSARPRLLKDGLDEPALWIDTHGKALAYAAMQQILKRHVQAAGVATPITPHALRRACATHMLEHGAHPLQLQLMLGHSSLKTLSQYLKLSITDLKKTHANSKPGK